MTVIWFTILLAGYVSGWKREMENPNLFGGDMILSPDQKKAIHDDKVSYGSIIGKRWPNAVIPYTISSSLGSQARRAIQLAIADYTKFTCLKWVPRKGERDYVNFYRGGGCSSAVGRQGGRMDLSLGSGCEDKGTAIHEMGHSIGLYHEQNRPDRDNYIKIHKSNVQQGLYYNFQKEYNVDSLGTPYDLRSIMHYSSTAFTRNYRYKTITTIDQSKQYLIDHGDRIFDFSPTDIKQINLMYNCKGTTVPTAPPDGCDNKDNNCEYWAKDGYCHDQKEKQWMGDNCCKACKGVKPPVTQVPPPTNCVNKEKECEWWARTGYCTDKQEAQYMADNCCKACKEYSCADNHNRCDEWANERSPSECQNNPLWMKRNCRKSCNIC